MRRINVGDDLIEIMEAKAHNSFAALSNASSWWELEVEVEGDGRKIHAKSRLTMRFSVCKMLLGMRGICDLFRSTNVKDGGRKEFVGGENVENNIFLPSGTLGEVASTSQEKLKAKNVEQKCSSTGRMMNGGEQAAAAEKRAKWKEIGVGKGQKSDKQRMGGGNGKERGGRGKGPRERCCFDSRTEIVFGGVQNSGAEGARGGDDNVWQNGRTKKPHRRECVAKWEDKEAAQTRVCGKMGGQRSRTDERVWQNERTKKPHRRECVAKWEDKEAAQTRECGEMRGQRSRTDERVWQNERTKKPHRRCGKMGGQRTDATAFHKNKSVWCVCCDFLLNQANLLFLCVFWFDQPPFADLRF
ncbi:hypothetical protein GPALN_005037 [Globodera pallida]|nr:hypothetical protein GPALN_005037 [Globodera pallida]